MIKITNFSDFRHNVSAKVRESAIGDAHDKTLVIRCEFYFIGLMGMGNFRAIHIVLYDCCCCCFFPFTIIFIRLIFVYRSRVVVGWCLFIVQIPMTPHWSTTSNIIDRTTPCWIRNCSRRMDAQMETDIALYRAHLNTNT